MMTKEEFDVAFLSRRCCIRADTMYEWQEINQYCVEQLGLFRSDLYETHDCEGYPYVYALGGHTVSAAARFGKDRIVLPFSDFLAITQQEEESILCGSLEEVL